MPLILTESIEGSVMKMLCLWRIPEEQAKIITATIVYAHTHEKHTHGITRLPIYKKKIDQGLMTSETKVTEISATPSMAVLDCNHGFGQVAAYEGMILCMKKARETGVGAVFVRNSNNFGVAGYFGELAADEGMIGLVITSSAPAIAAPNASRPIFGTNPFCCAFPGSEGNVVLDMAISEAARGKIRLAEKNGQSIPYGWAVDQYGNPTNNPTEALAGNLLAIGGVKGFGLAMVIDFLAGMMSGSAFGGAIKPLASEEGYSRHGHMLLAIDKKQIMSDEEYQIKIREFIANIKACGISKRILLPGENSREKAEKNHMVLELNQKQISDYNRLAHDYKLEKILEYADERGRHEQ